jgi:hypothetical protein
MISLQVGHGEASGAHNGVTLITEQQEPQQCEEQDTIVPVDLGHLDNEEDLCPSQCLTKEIIVPEGALHPAVATALLKKIGQGVLYLRGVTTLRVLW